MKRQQAGFALLLVVAVAAAITILGAGVYKFRRVGTSLYPEEAYPYQGPLMDGTNPAVAPGWESK